MPVHVINEDSRFSNMMTIGSGLVVSRSLVASQVVPTGCNIYVPEGVTIVSGTIDLQGTAQMVFLPQNNGVKFG